MTDHTTSSDFTNELGSALGPPLIGALLRIPMEAVRGRMLERLHEAGFSDFDATHTRVFQYPGPQGMRPSDLAAQLGVSKQALNYQLGELEGMGYLERRPHPDDRRAKQVVLTERGIAAGLVMREAVAEVEADWTAALGAERFERLRALLLDLNRLM
jgi:DNA-binding MarR family transcriptional regulator